VNPVVAVERAVDAVESDRIREAGGNDADEQRASDTDDQQGDDGRRKHVDDS